MRLYEYNVCWPCRFLVSFMGKYLAHDLCVSSSCGKTEGDAGSLNHHSFKISVPQTEPGIFGPAFVEVELPVNPLYK